jgi:hypothetical protein
VASGSTRMTRARAVARAATLAIAATSCAGAKPSDWSNQVDLTPPAAQPTYVATASHPPRARASTHGATSTVKCTVDEAFPGRLPVPEASAAAEVELKRGARELLVVSDSGNHGAALAWSIPSGPVRALTLPLDSAASDDLEGIAWVALPGSSPVQSRLYTLTSSGAVRRFAPDGNGGLVRDQDAYAIGSEPYACADLGDVNCGKNYEGLCLRKAPVPDACDGYAASKTESALYCIRLRQGRLAIDTSRPPLALALGRDTLSDCAFGAKDGPAEDTLFVTTNIFGGSRVFSLDEATGQLHAIGVPRTLNTEVVAVDRDGSLYELADTQGSSSFGLRATCAGW